MAASSATYSAADYWQTFLLFLLRLNLMKIQLTSLLINNNQIPINPKITNTNGRYKPLLKLSNQFMCKNIPNILAMSRTPLSAKAKIIK
jgi:hypothetical protein